MLVYQNVFYPLAGEYRTLHIWLPDSYYYSLDERYPVMYMFDGHNLFDDQAATYGRSWRMCDFLAEWDKQMIIVGMECSHNGNDRMYEYSPYPWRSKNKARQVRGDETMKWVTEVVKPMIDNIFRTWPHREATAIGGASMGGLMALYGVMRYNHVFSKAACLSSGVFRNLGNLKRDLESSHIADDTKVYIGWGEIEAGKAARNGNNETDTREARGTYKFERMLQEKSAETYHYFQPDGHHNEEDWEKQVPIFMNWLWCNRG